MTAPDSAAARKDRRMFKSSKWTYLALAAAAMGLFAFTAVHAAVAQDEPDQPAVTDAPPAEEAPPADTPPDDAAPTETPADAPPTDAPPTDAPPTDPPPAAPPEGQPAPQPERPAAIDPFADPDAVIEPVLAERFYELAQDVLRRQAVTEPMWRQAASLLQGATRLSPRDPRFHRLLIEARMKLGDVDGAIEALTNYRRLMPVDQVAQIQLIDLYVQRMQTADARLSYLRDVLKRESIPAEVRSHAAAMCVPLLLERSPQEAEEMLDEALRLNPLSPEVHRLFYLSLTPQTPPADHAAVLLAMLRSNPAQPDVISELANLLASQGITDKAIEWYTAALRVYPRTGRVYPEGFISSVGAQLLLAGQAQPLSTLLDSYLKARPEDADAWFMRLVQPAGADPAAAEARLTDARAALTARYRAVVDGVNGKEPPAPQRRDNPGAPGDAAAAPAAPAPAAPAGPPPDPAEVVKKLNEGEAEDWRAPFVNAVGDLAWFELFFAKNAAGAAPWISALKELLAEDSVTLVRLQGWSDLVAGKPDDARAKLSTVADRDPLAALGLVRLAGNDAAAQAEAADRANKLLNDYRTGIVAAMIWTGLGERAARPPEKPEATEVRQAVDRFPKDWLEILNSPDKYYRLLANVDKVAHKYKEPLYVGIEIRNLTDFDLTIGPDGIIRPDLWIDARVAGLNQQAFPGVAYDRIAGPVVLRARQKVPMQFVRVDQGALGQALAANPSVSAKVPASVLTNPIPMAGGVGPAPGGQRQAVDRDFVRSGFPLSQSIARKRVRTAVESGTTGEKIRNLDLMAAYVRLIEGSEKVEDAIRTIGGEFATSITEAQKDETPAVAAWARFLVAQFSKQRREDAVKELLSDELWLARLLGVMVGEALGPEAHADIAVRVAGEDADPTVRAFAEATVEHLKNPPPKAPGVAEMRPGGDATPAGDTGAEPRPPSNVSVPSDNATGPGRAE